MLQLCCLPACPPALPFWWGKHRRSHAASTANSAKSLLSERLRSFTTLTPCPVHCCAARRATRATTTGRKKTSKQVQLALKTQQASVLLSTTTIDCSATWFITATSALFGHTIISADPLSLQNCFFKPKLNCLNRCEKKFQTRTLLFSYQEGAWVQVHI